LIRRSLVGIFRETLHSPGRVFDDFEILCLTGEMLRAEGLEIDFFRPEEVARSPEWWDGPRPEIVFLMCEQERMLKPVSEWERCGTIVINSVKAIRNTYRHRMIPLLSSGTWLFPESELVSTLPPAREAYLRNLFRGRRGRPLWIKRGDVHNIQDGDVSLARATGEIRQLMMAFQSRGVAHAVLQENIEGDLVKLYGIGHSGEAWFRWFYHKGQELKRYPFSERTLRDAFFGAAKALDLEIFGGDAVVTSDGLIYVIDINAWPSFALFRKEAAAAITRYILSRISDPVP
jgi:hypothetical protein